MHGNNNKNNRDYRRVTGTVFSMLLILLLYDIIIYNKLQIIHLYLATRALK